MYSENRADPYHHSLLISSSLLNKLWSCRKEQEQAHSSGTIYSHSSWDIRFGCSENGGSQKHFFHLYQKTQKSIDELKECLGMCHLLSTLHASSPSHAKKISVNATHDGSLPTSWLLLSASSPVLNKMSALLLT